MNFIITGMLTDGTPFELRSTGINALFAATPDADVFVSVPSEDGGWHCDQRTTVSKSNLHIETIREG